MFFSRFVLLVIISCAPWAAQAMVQKHETISPTKTLLSNARSWCTQQTQNVRQHALKNLHALSAGIHTAAQQFKKSYTAQAETVFYKEDGAPICQKEHEIIYDIKLRNQFPMSTLYNNYHDNEIAAMQQQLAEKLPGVKVAFIPTTMYELFFMSYVNSHGATIREASGGLIYNYHQPEIIENTTITIFFFKRMHILEKIFLDSPADLPFEQINKTTEVKNCHLLLNNYIVDFLKHRSLNPSTANQRDYVQIYNDTGFKQSAFQDQEIDPTLDQEIDPTLTPPSVDNFKKILTNEYNAEKLGQWLLYRGTDKNDIKPDISGDISLSFGNSFLAGYLFDTTANAYFYMWRSRNGYLLPLSKKQYIHGTLNQMFHVPPLTTIAGLVAEGEFFHARSKMTNPLNVKGFFGCDGTEIPEFYTINDSVLEKKLIYTNIFNYIQQHRINIKDNEHKYTI